MNANESTNVDELNCHFSFSLIRRVPSLLCTHVTGHRVLSITLDYKGRWETLKKGDGENKGGKNSVAVTLKQSRNIAANERERVEVFICTAGIFVPFPFHLQERYFRFPL